MVNSRPIRFKAAECASELLNRVKLSSSGISPRIDGSALRPVSTALNLETAYIVPTGKTLFISKLVMANIDPAAKTWNISLDDTILILESIAALTTKEMDFGIPTPLTSGKTIKIQTGRIGNILTVVGWEI